MQIFQNVILLFSLSCIVGCGEKSNPADSNKEPADSTVHIEKSYKRGISYNLTDSLDLQALKNGVSWWYNWYYRTDAAPDYYEEYQMDFLPMLWGDPGENDLYHAKQFILSHPEIKYLLVMNEPNLRDQANMTPADAAPVWRKYEDFVEQLENSGREFTLVGPAMNWGTLSGYGDPVLWLDEFIETYKLFYGRDPRIDHLAFHWYDYGLAGQLDRLAKYGKKIWVSEMANWNPVINSFEKQKAQMIEMVNICESRDDVYRYAWFIGRGEGLGDKYTTLFEAGPGQLNELGQLYLSLPY